MVSVAFAIWLFPYARTPARAAAECPMFTLHAFMQQATCQFARLFEFALASILHSNRGRGGSDDVDDVSGLSEPHGPDGTMADRGCIGAEISQSRSARHFRQAVRTAGRRAGTDLAHLAHLYPPALRHRQGAGGQSGAGGNRGSQLRDGVRFAVAFQEGKFAGAAAPPAGGADCRRPRSTSSPRASSANRSRKT